MGPHNEGACVKAAQAGVGKATEPRHAAAAALYIHMACVRVVAFLVAAALAEQAPEVHVGPPAPACTIETCSG